MRSATLPLTALAKPNSRFGGVQIGINAPYSFHGMPGGADDVLKYLTELNLSAVELRSQPVEAFFGAPIPTRMPGRRAAPTAEQQAAIEALEKWRLAAPMDQFKQFRKKYEDAGVAIEIVKFDGVDRMSDGVVDYAFAARQGARGSGDLLRNPGQQDRSGSANSRQNTR